MLCVDFSQDGILSYTSRVSPTSNTNDGACCWLWKAACQVLGARQVSILLTERASVRPPREESSATYKLVPRTSAYERDRPFAATRNLSDQADRRPARDLQGV